MRSYAVPQLVHSSWLLANTRRLVVATGIANIYARDAMAMANAQRGLSEQSDGRFLGDIHHNGSTTTWLMARDGNLQPHGGVPNVKNVVSPYEADDIKVPAEVISYCLLVNKTMVKPQDEPKSWKDLFFPEIHDRPGS